MRIEHSTHGESHTSAIGRNAPRFVILGRSKERSDAAQTLGSMPCPVGAAMVQNFVPLRLD
ncbi:hypothetical protein A8146_08125 [Mesorhizobium loti]|nr:hypothetical protein A8146_08125 [Mesorhizobium loti]